MSLDGQSLAGVKNRVGKSQLNAELYRIDREKKAEMRMHNMSKQRFRAKYSKLEYYSERGKDASDVRMYETHNPGFCYRRNGECRIPQSSTPAPKVDYQDIHSLLFTNGEVDMEKVICLHLLTAHRTETLTPPAKYHRALSFLTKEQSPLERLIERSRKRRKEDSLTKLLPTYVIDVKKQKRGEAGKEKEDVLIRDGRLAERVIVNDKITQLVHTVMAALQESNPDKMNEFTLMVMDKDALNQIVEKPHIQEFLKSLNGHMLVSSCEAFHLTQPFKASIVPLTLDTCGDSLKNLVKQIRKNVLQFPEQSTWKTMYYKSQSRETEDEASLDLAEHKYPKKDIAASPSKEIVTIVEELPTTSKKNFIEKNKDTTAKFRSTSTPASGRSARLNTSRARSTSKNSKGKLFSNPSFVKGPKSSKYETYNRREELSTSTLDSEEIIYDVDFLKTTDVKGLASMLSSKAIAANKRVLRNMQKQEPNYCEESKIASDSQTRSKDTSVLQMTCPACMKKWDHTDVTKVQKMKKKPIPTLDQVTDDDINKGSIHRLSLMIDQEIKKLSLEERRSSKSNRTSGTTTPTSPKAQRKGASSHKKLEALTLDVLDLAKIAQEIKESETQKKVEKFLERQG